MGLFNKKYSAVLVVKTLQFFLVLLILIFSEYNFSSIYFLENQLADNFIILNDQLSLLSGGDSLQVNKNAFSSDQNLNTIYFILYSSINIYCVSCKTIAGPLGIIFESMLIFIYFLAPEECSCKSSLPKASIKSNQSSENSRDRLGSFWKEDTNESIRPIFRNEKFDSYSDVNFPLGAFEHNICCILSSQELLINQIITLSSYYEFHMLF